MFKVEVGSLEAYLAFDPARRADLEAMDALITAGAPMLERYFHAGTPAGQPGMRFKMIGYGRFQYPARDGTLVEWPLIGIALQKNYISVYVAAKKQGRPLTDDYAGRLGELRMGQGNFSFVRYSDLDEPALSAMVGEAQLLGPGT